VIGATPVAAPKGRREPPFFHVDHACATIPPPGPVGSDVGSTMHRMRVWLIAGLGAALLPAAGAQTPPSTAPGGATVYRCPGPPVLYTDALSATEARDRGCRALEGTPITVMQAPRPRPSAPAASGASAPRPGEARVDPAAQRQRDSDARRVLEGELRREEERLAALRRDYNNGEPERLGNERNYQTYLDRVAEMRANIVRTESDIVALRRELAKLPP
jgi:hypothetical protein